MKLKNSRYMIFIIGVILFCIALLTISVCAGNGDTIQYPPFEWCNYTWVCDKNPYGQSDPGSNYWDPHNVWLDRSTNEVHMKITKKEDLNWYCAEIHTTKKLEFGKYQFWVTGFLDELDPNVVFGMFNYPTPEEGIGKTNEIDIEIARWGNLRNSNLNYGFWPNRYLSDTQKFSSSYLFPSMGAYTTTTHRFIWQSDGVRFQSLHGFRDWNDNALEIYSAESPSIYAEYVPQKPLQLYINLWLFNGRRPAKDDDIEIVINKFDFVPESSSTQPNTSYPFKVTSGVYSETANLDQAVKGEFGNDYRVADWNDVKAHSADIQSWANSIGMDHNDYYFVTWNGQGFSGNRHYFITRFDGTVDPSYLVHDQIGGNIITLGSWYGIQERILAIRTTNTMPSVVPAQSCSGIISGRIINAASRAPVPNAKIYITDSGDYVYSGTADGRGYFRSSPIFCRSRTYKVVCDTLGYTPAFQDVVTDENGNANADISISQEFEVNPETCAEMGGNWQSGECKFENLL